MNKSERYYLSLLRERQNNPWALYSCYKSPSARKETIYYEIRLQCIARDGFGFSILTYNQQIFTCGYFYPDSETRELRARIELLTRTLDFAAVE